MVIGDRQLTHRSLSDELNTNKEIMTFYKRGRFVLNLSHIKLIDEQKQQRLTWYQDLSRQTHFLDCILSFIQQRVPSKKKGFGMLKASTKTWRPSPALFLCMSLLTDSKNILNDSTEAFKMEEITWNINTTIIGFHFLSHQSGYFIARYSLLLYYRVWQKELPDLARRS
jgi:hypothetical protein